MCVYATPSKYCFIITVLRWLYKASFINYGGEGLVSSSVSYMKTKHFWPPKMGRISSLPLAHEFMHTCRFMCISYYFIYFKLHNVIGYMIHNDRLKRKQNCTYTYKEKMLHSGELKKKLPPLLKKRPNIFVAPWLGLDPILICQLRVLGVLYCIILILFFKIFGRW